jgi:hypothetical protein
VLPGPGGSVIYPTSLERSVGCSEPASIGPDPGDARQMSPAHPGWRFRALTYRRGGSPQSPVTALRRRAHRSAARLDHHPGDTMGAEIPSRTRIGTDHRVKRSLDRCQRG